MTSSRSLPVRLSPRPVRTLARRISSSSFAQDLYWERHTIAICLGVLLIALGIALISRGYVVSWDGVHPVPTDAVYTGTDAGLVTSPATP